MAEDNTKASFRLVVNPDPRKDTLVLYMKYRGVYLQLSWSDADRQDVRDLFSVEDPLWFLDRGHLEYEVHRQSAEIDTDLHTLFPEVDEEVEDDQ